MGNTQEEVRKALQRACTAIDDGTYMEPNKITVGEWLSTWKDEYLANVKHSTVISYSQHIKNHLEPGFGKVKLMALKTVAIQKFYNAKLKSGLSPKTIKNIHGVLHKALKQAVLLGYLRSNPADNCIMPRIEKKDIEPLDTPEIETFLKAVKGNPLEALFKVDLFTGMRQGEILGLQWECVDFERGQIVVNKQLCRPR